MLRIYKGKGSKQKRGEVWSFTIPWAQWTFKVKWHGVSPKPYGMPSNGYVPKVAVHNTIAIYNFYFKKNIWAKYWWKILCFNHSIHEWFKNIFNHIALPSMWNFTLVYAVTLNTGHQCPLVGSFFTSSFPQFWNPLWPWLQRYLPDGDVNTHFQILAEPLLAGFWQRCFYNITYYQV